MLRYQADRRSVLFMLLATGLLVYQWLSPEFHWYLYACTVILAHPIYAMVHNHLHVPIWKSKAMNVLQDYWLTVFYGYPVFAWISTHVMNHHVLNNRPGDDSATWQHTEANNFWSLARYPGVSGGVQQKVNVRFIQNLWKTNRSRALYFISQAAVLLAFNVTALILNWQKALYLVLLPQQISLIGVLMVNYVQHVHADEESHWNHSRNFVGRFENWFMLNNGYHTIHHEKPLQHWSLNDQAHEKIKDHITPHLNEPSMVWFFIRAYVLSLVMPKYRTRSMRLDRIAQERAVANQGVPTPDTRHVPLSVSRATRGLSGV